MRWNTMGKRFTIETILILLTAYTEKEKGAKLAPLPQYEC